MSRELTVMERLVVSLYKFNKQLPINRDIPTFMVGAQFAFLIALLLFLLCYGLFKLILPPESYTKNVALVVTGSYIIISFYLLFYFDSRFKVIIFKAIDLGIFPEEERGIINKKYRIKDVNSKNKNLVNYCPDCNRIEKKYYKDGRCSICGNKLRTID